MREIYKTLEKDPLTVVVLETDENGELQMIYVQTPKMKEIFSKFPSVCMMDTTYKHNNVNFCLASIMVVDGDGNGEIVAHAWLSRDSCVHWKLFPNKFRELNDSASEIGVCVIDKDFAEIRAITDVLPHAAIHLCLFHAQQAFNKHLNEKLDQDKRVLSLLSKMMYGSSEKSYTEAYEEIVSIG